MSRRRKNIGKKAKVRNNVVRLDSGQKKRRIRERRERVATRIKRDIRGWIGWDYIEKVVDRANKPDIIMALFLTGGRATEVLALARGHFADMGAYFEVRGMPVYKKYDVLETYEEEPGKKRWVTQLVEERRTFPILKSEPLAKPFWELIKDKEGSLFQFKIPRSRRLWQDQYWQLYKEVRDIDAPQSPLAPMNEYGKQKNLYPHWFRGMRAAQLRVEYGLGADDLMKFFRWADMKMALYYAGLSSYQLASKMMQGRDQIRQVMKTEG